MPLVNAVQIPQDLGMNAQPQPLAVQQDMFKMAGAEAALMDLGLVPAKGMEKDAFWGHLAKWGGGLLARLGGRAAASGAGAAARTGAGAAARTGTQAATQAATEAAKQPGMLSRAWGATGGKVVGGLAKPLERAGTWAAERGGKALGLRTETIDKIKGLGAGMGREAVGFGLLSGGMNAAFAEPGERGSAFLRGAASGALGGLAFRGASNVASAGLKRGLGAAGANVGKIQAAADKPWLLGKGLSWGERARGVGASALMGGVPFMAAMAASSYAPTFDKHAPGQTQFQRYAPYAARLGGGMMGAYPSHPMGYAYNPNLPMPQYGY